MIKDKSIYYNDGYKASFVSSRSKEDNPYPPTAEEHWKRDEWNQGWLDGDADIYEELTED